MSIFSDFSPDNPLILVGSGNMGGAMLQSWLSSGLDPKNILILDKNFQHENVKVYRSVEAFPSHINPRMIVYALKPQIMPLVLSEIQGKPQWLRPSLSVAAGYSLESLKKYLGETASIIRAMPNTPAQVGKGISGMYASPTSDQADCQLAEALLSGCGKVIWVESEDQIDMVTGVSGSGPAYFYFMVEALTEAGKRVGLSEDIAYELAKNTFIGAASLFEQSEDTATILRKNVTSPNGTTQAALEILMQDEGLQILMRRAVRAATERARELAQ